MKRIWNRAIIGAVLGVGLALSAPLRAETLPDALIAAYRNSNLLEQNRVELEHRQIGLDVDLDLVPGRHLGGAA